MIKRSVLEKRFGNRDVRVQLDDYGLSGGGVVVSSVDLNHAIHALGESDGPQEWILRDAAAVNGVICVIEAASEEHPEGRLRELTDEEANEWDHRTSAFAFLAPPVPAFKVGAVDGRQTNAEDAKAYGDDEATPVAGPEVPEMQGEDNKSADKVEENRDPHAGIVPTGHGLEGLSEDPVV